MMAGKSGVLDGTAVLLKELSGYVLAITGPQLADILDEGAGAMISAMTANLDGHDRSGKLRQSISYKFVRDSIGGNVIAVDFGWKKLARPSHSKGAKKVYTSTYGPILDNSEKRQLPHMRVGFDVAGEYISDHMAARARSILDSAGDPF